jgi:hypothetical protein
MEDAAMERRKARRLARGANEQRCCAKRRSIPSQSGEGNLTIPQADSAARTKSAV